MRATVDKPLNQIEARTIRKALEGKLVRKGSTYLVSIGGNKVRITFHDEGRIGEDLELEPPKRYRLGEGYECPEFLKKNIPPPQPSFIDDGTNIEERVRRALYHFKQVGLVGPTGVGKTHLVYKIAAEDRLPIFEINCALQTSVYELIGKYVGLGRENWVDGTIVMWCRYGGILYVDEANMMKPDILAKFHPVMDQRGHLVLTEKENEIVERHPYGYIVLSFNPYSVEYAGTKPLNVAFRRRVNAWIHFDYLSVGPKINEKEVEALIKRSGLKDPSLAYKFVKVAAELRRLYEIGEIPLAPSLGNLISWARLVQDGVSIKDAAVDTIINSISDDPAIQATLNRIIESILETPEGA
ncbi:AAA family ATPase [Candidatus Bathyarchaeota archaeon]|nr:MAG: AAA family ATPase [Candidatus Bathyarchaeota archaeon]